MKPPTSGVPSPDRGSASLPPGPAPLGPATTGDVTGANSGVGADIPDAEGEWTYIDLPSALRLAGAQNGDIMIAYQRTLASTAAMQLAAAQALPNLNGGGNFDGHSGALQQASGNILNVTRDSFYVGAGGNAVAAGTVSVPGIQYNLNLSDTIFNYLVSRPQLDRTRWLAQATTNDVQLQVCEAYGELLRAEGRRAIVRQSRDNAAEVARVTANFARIGQGRDADAQRAATELERRQADLLESESGVLAASGVLVQRLNLQNSIRLRTAEPWIVPRSIVPDPIPLNELVATAVYQRPELAAQRAAIHAALLRLQSSRLLLFSPQILAGYSAGTFGGGSYLIANDPGASGAPPGTPRFGDFAPRADVDAAMYWSLRNLGFGNRAMIETARARLQIAELEQLVELNRVREQVAEAYARKQTQLAVLLLRQQAVETGQAAFDQDLRRVRSFEGRPIEVLESLRLAFEAREAYVNAIVDYNVAQFALYTALGRPPIDLLVRPTSAAVPNSPRPPSAKPSTAGGQP